MKRALAFLFDESMEHVLLFRFVHGLNGVPAICLPGEVPHAAIARRIYELSGKVINPLALSWFGNLECTMYIGAETKFMDCYCGTIDSVNAPNAEWHDVSEFDVFSDITWVNAPHLIRAALAYLKPVSSE